MKFSAVLLLVLCFENGICRHSTKAIRRNNATPKDPHTNTIEYYTDSRPRKISIPIMIHLDKPLTRDLSQKHRKTVKNYFQDVLKSVETLFRHPSLNQTIHFKLLGVKLLRNTTKKFQMNENVSKYLNSYCQWQGDMKELKKQWFYSVLFTGLDVYHLDARKNKVRSSTGRSYMRGICSMRNSCTILEWHSQNIAYIMAHEVAHRWDYPKNFAGPSGPPATSLGVTHDGLPYNQCRAQRYIMGAKYSPRNPATAWSPCNKQALDKFLMSKHSRCLHPSSALTFKRF